MVISQVARIRRREVIIGLVFIIAVTPFYLIPSVSASEKITLEAIASKTCSNSEDTTVEGLKIGQLYGVAWVSYVMFDFSQIPQGATVESVKLKLKSESFIPTGNRFVSTSTTSADWTEESLTWDNKPEANEYAGGTVWIDIYNEWYTWDCTYNLKTQRDKVAIFLELSSDMNGYVVFYSRDSAYPPQIEITYNAPKPTPTPEEIEPTTIIIGGILFFGIIAVIGVVGFLVFRRMFPKAAKYPPPPPPP